MPMGPAGGIPEVKKSSQGGGSAVDVVDATTRGWLILAVFLGRFRDLACSLACARSCSFFIFDFG